MFGIGYQEMMVIALIALVIFGPGKLPEVMRQAGGQYKKFKNLADEMTGQLNEVTAEARKELDGALGDLGPMGKDIENSLGMKNSHTRTTSTGKASTSKSTARSSTAGGSQKSTGSSSSRKTTSGRKTSTSSSSKSKTDTSKARTTAHAEQAKKPVVASKEEPLAGFSMFETDRKPPRRRSRSATPNALTDITPRDLFGDVEPQVAEKTPVAEPVDISKLDDPVARARARRRTAGYARA